MKRQLVLIAFFSFLTVTSALAHALWIETDGKGTLGKSHAIKIFYGEYAAGEFEKTDAWYSDVNTFQLWLISPDGKKTPLTYTAAGDHYTSSFTPDQQGAYTLAVGHSAKEVNRKYVYQFNSSAIVSVGKASSNTHKPSNELYLEAEKDAKGKAGIVRAYFKGQPAADITITISGPTGWSKNFKTDKNGVLQFEAQWKGTYALEGFYTTEETGTQHEAEFDHIWRCATTRIDL